MPHDSAEGHGHGHHHHHDHGSHCHGQAGHNHSHDLADHLQVEVEVIPANPWGIWDMLDTLNEEFAPVLNTEDEEN